MHVFALSAFAVAWPIYDLLTRHAGFLVAHRATPLDIVLLVALLSVGVPLVIVLVEVLAGLFGRRVQRGAHLVIVTLLAACAFSWVLSKLPGGGQAWMAAVAVLLGVATSVAYAWFRLVPMFLSAMSIAVVAFPLIFLLNQNTAKLLWGTSNIDAVFQEVDSDTPVVLIVFDEFPTTSLMDADRHIDAGRYPSFAALADDATWYRHATSVHELTGLALPAIATGNYATGNNVPTASEFPYNVFTLLGGSYDLRSFEAFTQLCPTGRFGPLEKETFAQRLRSTLLDLSVVYLHVMLPSGLTTGLPAVSQTQRDFVGASRQEFLEDVNRAFGIQLEHVGAFLQSIEPVDQPTLFFAHIYLPHKPWVYLPSGRLYMPPNAIYMPGYSRDDDLWGPSDFFVLQALQRHLIQLAMTDRLLGRILQRLKESDLYDRSLIIVTADHGVAFWENHSSRDLGQAKYAEDILCVPLLIKEPFQTESVVSDQNVEVIDILPTIADVLDVDLPWPVDGRSVRDPERPQRGEIRMATRYGDVRTFDGSLENMYEIHDRLISAFGSGDMESLWRFGSRPELVGKSLAELPTREPWAIEVTILPDFLDFADLYADAFVPALLAGRMNHSFGRPFEVALAVNGTIRAVVPSFSAGGNDWFWQAFMPEDAFQQGINELELYAIDDAGVEMTLHRLIVEPSQLTVKSLDIDPLEQVEQSPARSDSAAPPGN